ncbi:skin secretory protein xP2-like [Lathamus discolor]|uniref:skin secretory protein xP2-like n=1 Tax=Lathamus discolor TaxID=678569 RepID=UPI0032B7D365
MMVVTCPPPQRYRREQSQGPAAERTHDGERPVAGAAPPSTSGLAGRPALPSRQRDASPGCPALPARQRGGAPRRSPALPCPTAPRHPRPGGGNKARSLPTHTQNGGLRFPTARSAAIAGASALQPFCQSDAAVPPLNDLEEPMETSVVEEEEGRAAASGVMDFVVPCRGGVVAPVGAQTHSPMIPRDPTGSGPQPGAARCHGDERDGAAWWPRGAGPGPRPALTIAPGPSDTNRSRMAVGGHGSLWGAWSYLGGETW